LGTMSPSGWLRFWICLTSNEILCQAIWNSNRNVISSMIGGRHHHVLAFCEWYHQCHCRPRHNDRMKYHVTPRTPRYTESCKLFVEQILKCSTYLVHRKV
jgi:hypothetical protein